MIVGDKQAKKALKNPIQSSMGVNMGWMTRLEPATSGSTDRRSNQLSYIHHKMVLRTNYFFYFTIFAFY